MAVKHMRVTPWKRLLAQSTICVMSIDEALGKSLRYFRTLAGIRQEDMPIDQGNLSKIERGRQSLSVEKLAEIATAMRTTPSAIWAKAEELMHADKPRTSLDVERAIASAGERTEYQVSLASFVEAVISTTPDAKPALAVFLRKALALATTRSDRKILTALLDRVAPSRAQQRPRSASSRARAPV